MTGERPATIPSERGQSAVNGGRGSPLIALVDRSPVTQVFMPKTCWIKCAPPGAFPPSDKMGEVMSYDLHGRRCASLRLQECKILLNRWMHALSSLACDRTSLLFYHSHTDSAPCENTGSLAQRRHLLQHVPALLDGN